MGPKLTQAEGFVPGVGVKMFMIAGSVIVYGVSASVVYGLIYWITTLFKWLGYKCDIEKRTCLPASLLFIEWRLYIPC